MRNNPVVRSAVTISLVAALGVSGCGETSRPANSSPTSAVDHLVPAGPVASPLPPADVLSAVLARLADGSVPAEQKVALVQYATVDDRPALTNFGEALRASGFDPLTVQVADLRWGGDPGDVTANVTLGSPNPAVKPFTYPMEFSPAQNTWQLSRRTADQLLPLVGAPPR